MSKTPIGNIKGFGIDLIQNILFVVGVGYMGGSVSSLCALDDIESIFSFPDSSKMCSVRKFVKQPLQCTSYLSYPQQYIKKDDTWLWNRYVNWLIDMYARTFEKIYMLYIATVSVGNDYVKPENFFGSMFVFYILPVILIFLTHLIPTIGVCIAIVLSTFYYSEQEEGYMFSLSPFFGWLIGLSTCNTTLSFMCIVRVFAYWIATSFFPLITIPWLVFIYIILWIWLVGILYRK